MTKKASTKYSPEVRKRTVWMVLDHQRDHTSQSAAIGTIAAKITCTMETLRGWVQQAERDQGLPAGPTSDDRERIKAESTRNRGSAPGDWQGVGGESPLR